ncbi:MAG: hypothetical protein ACLQUY_15130 [Ktedonobacterales bacterium]
MDTNTIIVILALVLSLPGSLFIGFRLSARRARFAAVFAGIIGAVATAAAIYLYIHGTPISLDGLSYFLGAFFGCSVGSFIGVLLANFAVGTNDQAGDVTSSEY